MNIEIINQHMESTFRRYSRGSTSEQGTPTIGRNVGRDFGSKHETRGNFSVGFSVVQHIVRVREVVEVRISS